MVTSIATASQPGRPTARQQAQLDEKSIVFPLFSPPSNETSYLKSNRSEKTSDRTNPFLSPNLSESSTNDAESGASSEQDEFHLERYSSTLNRRQEGQLPRGKSRARARPDLNVVTRFPTSQVRAFSPGVKVEEVNAKKTAAKTRARSVISAKAEHVFEAGFGRRAKALANVRDLAARRADKMKREQIEELSGASAALQARPNILENGQAVDDSPIKPILIGISVPKHEADAHDRKLGHESAISLITPGTPQIVITPAEEEGPWHQQQRQPKLKPVSSVYSQWTKLPGAQIDKSATPLVPHVARQYDNASHKLSQAPSGAPKGILVRHDSFESIAYESPEHLPNLAEDPIPRNSSESQQRILPNSSDTGRPKSQGWWNLALSPMLSRAGTIKRVFNRSSPADAKVPPLPSGPSKRLSRSTTFDSEASPETPRRAGMASARASTWSRWTSWERTKNRINPAEQTRDDDPTKEYAGQDFGSIANAAAISGRGLAAEYFHACAIEQLSQEPYFECKNHSCAEKLPKLQSIFDPQPVPDVIGSAIVVPVSELEADHPRTPSDSYRALLEPAIISPNVREANMAMIGKATAVESPLLKAESSEKRQDDATLRALEGTADPTPTPAPRPVPPPPRALSTRYPNIAAIVPPPPAAHSGAVVASPGPVSPEAQQTMGPPGAVPMSEIQNLPQHINYYNQYHYPQRDVQTAAPTLLNVYNEPQKEATVVREKAAAKEFTPELDEGKEKKRGMFARLKQCAKARKAKNTLTDCKSKRRKRLLAILIALILMIIGAVLLATQLTRHGDGTPVQQQWLNLTGYPPMPTGISTIIRPDITKTQAQCAAQNMWSCALPKEDQPEVAPNNPDQPNFRFEIKFENGTVASNMTVPLSKRLDNPFSENLFTPNPPPPSRADQIFMGNTTDNATEPFDGEATPFFMTFIPAFPVDPNDAAVTNNVTSRLARRQQTQNITDAIPSPDVQPDGSAAPANLLPEDPFPFSQPIRLYNRGQQTEHYGFYMYYDKAIFLSANAADSNDTSDPTSQENEQDASGGSLRSQARARCTFSQTRFLVQIFTNPSFGGHLLGSINQTANSAINYTPPGSFPYPTTITVDRHGGNINKKAAYCYGVDGLQVIQDDVKAVVAELRNVGGQLINAAPSLFEVEGDESDFDQEAGGIDGGTGGCECVWQNWG